MKKLIFTATITCALLLSGCDNPEDKWIKQGQDIIKNAPEYKGQTIEFRDSFYAPALAIKGTGAVCGKLKTSTGRQFEPYNLVVRQMGADEIESLSLNVVTKGDLAAEALWIVACNKDINKYK